MLLESGPWTFGWEALVAITTGGLALATFFLGWQARREANEVAKESEAVKAQADAVAEQVTLQREQTEAALRPNVYPVVLQEWVQPQGTEAWLATHGTLPIQNAGPGVAANVVGQLWKGPMGGEGFAVQIYGGTLPPGETRAARVSVMPQGGWADSVGFLHYFDALGRAWRTRFQLRHGMNNTLIVDHQLPEPSPGLDETKREHADRYTTTSES